MFPEFKKYSLYPKSKGTITSTNTIVMKTAMQELEDKLKDNLKWIVLNADYELMDKLFIEAIEKEKEQIKKAFSDGQETPINHPTLPHYSREEYYNDNYNHD